MKRFLKISLVTLLIIGIALFFIGKSVKFNQDFAYILFDRNDQIINASVSKDQQWRMECDNDIPKNLKNAILLFEDEYFYRHPGINPISIAKAAYDNYKAGRIVRGGSTITMQLARISQGNQSRHYKQKIKEMIIALSIELAYSKDEILELYGQYAPFGGNVVGYCGASWKYFDKSPEQLSWAEVASLAVLPNAPGQIFPGKGQKTFLRKRNFLLNKLHQKGYFDQLSLQLALKESLPVAFKLFDQKAPHLHQYLKSKTSYNEQSAIDGDLQDEVIQILDNYGKSYSANGINNLMAMVIDNTSGEIISYVGNRDHSPHRDNRHVDIIRSQRSPGSTMKPLLYALSFDEGLITSESLIEDVPLFLNGFSPQNYDHKFSGLIKAKDALTQSLNIPAVNLLQDYGLQLFIDRLNQMGFQHTNKDDDHYGLSLILGSNEVTPLELGTAYMNLARRAQGKKSIEVKQLKNNETKETKAIPISQTSALNIIDVLTEVKRPRERDGWEYFNSKRSMAWKTGTSYGNRDGWAVGVTPQHTIVVWVGNASGEGRKGLTGLSKGAPILFSILDFLPFGEWFPPITQDYKTIEICKHSGYSKSEHCLESKIIVAPKNNKALRKCHYHQHFVLDQSRTYQITNQCYDLNQSIDTSLFVLAPRINHYYKLATGIDLAAPPTHPACQSKTQNLAIIYPPSDSHVLLPREINNEQKSLISKAASAMPNDTLYWFVDDAFVSLTTEEHSIMIPSLEIGQHSIAVTSIHGNRTQSYFEVIEE